MQQKIAKKNNFKLDHFIRYAIIIPVGVAGYLLFSLLNTDRGIFQSLKAFSFQYFAIASVSRPNFILFTKTSFLPI